MRDGQNLAHLLHRPGIAGIAEHRKPAETGDDLAQDFEPLGGRISRLGRQAGDVAARPRQARDETAPNRVRRQREHDRDRRGCPLGCRDRGARGDDDVDLSVDELGHDLGIALDTSLCPAILDRHVAALCPAELAQSPHKGGGPMGPGRGRADAEESDGRHLPGCCARAASGHAAAAPPSSVMNSRRSHSITSSARASSIGGRSMLSALAVLRLTISSSRVGCSMGRSPGFSPFKMRST